MPFRSTQRFGWTEQLIAEDVTLPDTRVAVMETEPCKPKGDRATPGAVEASWVLSQLDVATQILAVSEAMKRAADAGMNIRELAALRRAFGGWTVLADGLHHVCEEAEHKGAFDPESPCVKYVDAVQWWLARLTLGVGDLFVQEPLDADTLAVGILEACEFATLYALSHMALLYDACERAHDDPLGPACARLHDDVAWLTWQLKDLVDR
jgi:hypothetical protein